MPRTLLKPVDSEKVRNLVDARTLRDSGAFPAELLAAGTFKRPSKEVIQAAHKVFQSYKSYRRSYPISRFCFLTLYYIYILCTRYNTTVGTAVVVVYLENPVVCIAVAYYGGT